MFCVGALERVKLFVDALTDVTYVSAGMLGPETKVPTSMFKPDVLSGGRRVTEDSPAGMIGG